MHKLIMCALAGALLFAACGSDDKGKDATPVAGTTPGAQPPGAATPCDGSEQGGSVGKYSAAPPMTIDQDKKYFATIKMDIGDIKLELFAKDAPCHVNSFVFLSRDGFYDDVIFHRVIPGFVAQGGDPTGTGGGGPGYTIKLEVNANKHVDGALGMARTNDPNSAGSQWFIDYGPQPALDEGYTVFGQIVEGRDVLDKIAPGEPPAAPTKINTIEIEEQ